MRRFLTRSDVWGASGVERAVPKWCANAAADLTRSICARRVCLWCITRRRSLVEGGLCLWTGCRKWGDRRIALPSSSRQRMSAAELSCPPSTSRVRVGVSAAACVLRVFQGNTLPPSMRVRRATVREKNSTHIPLSSSFTRSSEPQRRWCC